MRLIKVEINEKEDKVKEADPVEENIDDTNKQLNWFWMKKFDMNPCDQLAYQLWNV